MIDSAFLATFLQYIFNGVVLGSIYAILGAGLALIYGISRIANFAQGSFLVIGAYVTYFIFNLLVREPLSSILISFLIVFSLGALTDKFLLGTLRNKVTEWLAPAFILTTGLMLIIDTSVFLIWGGTYRNIREFYGGTLSLGPLSMSLDRIFILAFSLCVFIFLHIFLYKTDLGRAIRAVAQNREAASLMGIKIDQIHLISFGIGVGLAAIAGGLILPIYSLYHKLGDEALSPAFTVVILGGVGSIKGALIAAFILGVTESFITGYFGAGLAKIAFFMITILILVVKPSGLMGVRP